MVPSIQLWEPKISSGIADSPGEQESPLIGNYCSMQNGSTMRFLEWRRNLIWYTFKKYHSGCPIGKWPEWKKAARTPFRIIQGLQVRMLQWTWWEVAGHWLYLGDTACKMWTKAVKEGWQILGLNNCKDGVAMNWDGKAVCEKGFGWEICRSDLGMWSLKWNSNNSSERMW